MSNHMLTGVCWIAGMCIIADSEVIGTCLHVFMTQNLICNKLTKYFSSVSLQQEALDELLNYGIKVWPALLMILNLVNTML